MQIFGRAGRPQFDTFGEGHIITTHDLLSKYVSMLTQQQPIESQLMNSLADSLNAEVGEREKREREKGREIEGEKYMHTYMYIYYIVQFYCFFLNLLFSPDIIRYCQ